MTRSTLLPAADHPHVLRNWLSYGALALSIAFGTAGQLLMKWAAVGALSGSPDFRSFLQLGFAVGVYCLGIVNWIIALRTVPLGLAYPLTSLTYVGVLAGSYFLLGETVGILRLAGVSLIFAGVMLVVLDHNGSDGAERKTEMRKNASGGGASSSSARTP